MAWLADDKHYATRTITLRLSAIKAFLAYAAAEDIALIALSQAVRTLKAIPHRGNSSRPHRGRDPGRPFRFHRAHGEITPEPDAAHPAQRHRRESQRNHQPTLQDLSPTKPGHASLTGKRNKTGSCR